MAAIDSTRITAFPPSTCNHALENLLEFLIVLYLVRTLSYLIYITVCGRAKVRCLLISLRTNYLSAHCEGKK